MLSHDYADQTCLVARSPEVVCERWTLLILRDLFLGVDRFDALVRSLGVTRTVLARRLTHLVDEGVVERRRYSERPERYSYHPTPKGQELMGVVALLMQWGDRHLPHPDGPPSLLHRGCGGPLDAHLDCGRCGARLHPSDIDAPLSAAGAELRRLGDRPLADDANALLRSGTGNQTTGRRGEVTHPETARPSFRHRHAARQDERGRPVRQHLVTESERPP